MNKELKKQLGDQALHFFGGLFFIKLVVMYPILMAALVAVAFWSYREAKQWPSSRWYDPPLDWLFQAGGIVLAIWWVL